MKNRFKGKIALICGASQGIGKSIASKFYQEGSSICMVARRAEVLRAARKEIERRKPDVNGQFAVDISCDTTDMEMLQPLMEAFIEKHGLPDYLVNLVGGANPGYVESYTLNDFKHSVNINYYGQLVPTLIFLPRFKERGSGHVVFTSSVAGFMSITGYAAHAPAKAALIALAESLKIELSPSNIGCSVLLPPDVDTPGLAVENKSRPDECRLMSKGAELLSPEKVAADLLDGLAGNRFYITPGKDAPFYWYLKRLFPNLTLKLIDRELRKIRRKLGK